MIFGEIGPSSISPLKTHKMVIFKHSKQIASTLASQRASGKRIGFVPTMGALHAGHLGLVKQSKACSDLTVCSIFVNPTQFNRKDDLENYPKTIERDINLLEEAGCDYLFLPSVEEMYPPTFKAPHYELGSLESILEGKFRPGHFQGVCQIVDILLNIIQPQKLFLGEKDFQQCLVISKMIALRKYHTEAIICATEREQSGLAMSSRNMRLNNKEKLTATAIFQSLNELKNQLTPGPLELLKSEALRKMEKAGLQPEYLEICSTSDLTPLQSWDGKSSIVALTAAFMGEVRLIDNLRLFPN